MMLRTSQSRGPLHTSVGTADQWVNILQYIVVLDWRGKGGINQRATAGQKERQK